MIDIGIIINFIIISFCVALPAIGVAMGSSIAFIETIRATYIQPSSRADIIKASIIGTALIETSAIFGLVISIILLTNTPSNIVNYYYFGLSNLGIASSICITGFIVGIASSYPVKYACLAIARQPFYSNKILNIMLITLSFMQAPIIFGFIISLFINSKAFMVNNINDALKYIGSGLTIGLGCIGPIFGLALFSKSACQGIGINTKAYNKILTFTFVSQALIETPVVFALIIAILLITSSPQNLLQAIALLSASLCIGISNIMPGFNSGKTAAAACDQIAFKPEIYSTISRVSTLAQSLIDSFAIYGFLIALLLNFFAR